MSNLTGNALRDIFAMQSSSSIKEVRENANAVLAEFARLERELATARADYACLNQTYRDMMHWYGERGRKIAELEKSADVEYAVRLRAALTIIASEPYPGPERAAQIASAALAKNPAAACDASNSDRSPALNQQRQPDTVLTERQQAAEFAVWASDGEDTDFVAQVNGPRETALDEARRYALQAVAVGDTAIIEEVTRREVERLSPVEELTERRVCTPEERDRCTHMRCDTQCRATPSSLPVTKEKT